MKYIRQGPDLFVDINMMRILRTPTHPKYEVVANNESPTNDCCRKLAIVAATAIVFFLLLFIRFDIGGSFSLAGICSDHIEQHQLTPKNNDDGAPIITIDVQPDDEPRIAWLMTFPNSGTTYTKLLVYVVSGYNTASNYGNGDEGWGTNTPIWEDELPHGPFYSGHAGNNWTIPRSPASYVLTKTHCGAFCMWCESSQYIITATQFGERCGRTSYSPLTNDTSSELILHQQYDVSLTKRAVHLIRDPFSNIVARFHFHTKKLIRQNETQPYSIDEVGFRKMCKNLDDQFRSDTKSSSFYNGIRDLIKIIPCHTDLYRWVQWHNHAFATTWDLGLPTLIMHYENYTNNFNQTVELLFNFLQLDMVHDAPLFITGKSYRDYFTEKDAVREMVKKLALKNTWKYIEHYF